jgi:hypothetical protein
MLEIHNEMNKSEEDKKEEEDTVSMINIGDDFE